MDEFRPGLDAGDEVAALVIQDEDRHHDQEPGEGAPQYLCVEPHTEQEDALPTHALGTADDFVTGELAFPKATP